MGNPEITCDWHANGGWTRLYKATHIIVAGNLKGDIWDAKACDQCAEEITRMFSNGGRDIWHPEGTTVYVDMVEIGKL